MGLVADLLAAARAAHDLRPLFATHLVVGPRFTAIGAAPTPSAHQPTAGGIVHNDGAGGDTSFDTGAQTLAVSGRVLGRPLHELASAIAAAGTARAAGRPSGAAGWPQTPVEERIDIGGAALNAALNAALAPVAGGGGHEAAGFRVSTENGVTLLLEASVGKRFVAVGHVPYVQRIREVSAQSWVLDDDPGEGHTPLSALPEVLPRAEVVGITGTALVDGLLERVAGLCPPGAFVVMVGPSTPLSGVLFTHGVSALSGSVVADPARVLDQLRVSHDGPTPRLEGMRPVTLHALGAAAVR